MWPRARLTWTDGQTGGRVQAIPPQSGVTACDTNSTAIMIIIQHLHSAPKSEYAEAHAQ